MTFIRVLTIFVTEIIPGKIEVIFLVKEEGQCTLSSTWERTILGLITKGFEIIELRNIDSRCKEFASVHWAVGKESFQEEMFHFVVMISNNLHDPRHK